MHRYLKKSRLLKFVMCRLLVLPFPGAFLQQPLTVLTKQTRQAVHAIKLISLSFLDVYGFKILTLDVNVTDIFLIFWTNKLECLPIASYFSLV